MLTERMALRRFTPADAASLLSLDGDVECRLPRADWAAAQKRCRPAQGHGVS